MFRGLRARRRPRYGTQACAVVSALLLLLSVSVLYSRLSHAPSQPRHPQYLGSSEDGFDPRSRPVLLGVKDDDVSSSEDNLDDLEIVEEDPLQRKDLEEGEAGGDRSDQPRVRGYFFDHATGAIRRAFDKRSIEEWDDDRSGSEDRSKAAFGSDDVPVDEMVRRKASEVASIEEALLLKTAGRGRGSPLREGWGDWFEKKSDYLRRDKTLKSSFESLNPLNNPMLQDPDGFGVTTLTRGDRLVHKLWLNEFKRTPFGAKKPLSVSDTIKETKSGENLIGLKRAERTTLAKGLSSGTADKNDGVLILSDNKGNGLNDDLVNDKITDPNRSDRINDEVGGELGGKTEFSGHIYADGNRWGYYPGLHPRLSFSQFMNAFFRKGKCDVRVFMVWNSPPWMYSVRHQRGLESLFSHHPDACVVMFSETIDLDFFRRTFVKDGFKVAVAMPNLDELLKGTPTHEFASAWFEWRKTKFYPSHYSELVRLAALYKYGGIYLDSDIIVLNSLSGLINSVGMEDLGGSSLNGAVMAFKRHSRFIMECLKEFYMTYDDTRLRWNGAELLTRVARKFSNDNTSAIRLELNVQASFIFFPISSQNITRYFTTPATKTEKALQDALFGKILKESLTFHFWNSLTSALIPEPDSLVARLIDHPCIRCFDVL